MTLIQSQVRGRYRRSRCFETEALEAHAAGGVEQAGADLAGLDAAQRRCPRAGPSSSLLKPGLALEQRHVAQVVAVDRDQVEGVKLRFVVVPVGMQDVEVGDALARRERKSRRR